MPSIKSVRELVGTPFRLLSPTGLMGRAGPDVRYWHIADVPLGLTNVCFEGNNGHDVDVTRYVLITNADVQALYYPVLS